MQENGQTAWGGRHPSETRELMERCRAMEKDLEELKKRILQLQRRLEGEVKRQELLQTAPGQRC
jgi:hypothetical protein